MKKINLWIVFVMGILLTGSVMAAEECVEENNVGLAVHLISIVLIIFMVIITFMAASMFSEGLGNAMKIIGAGMVLVGLSNIMEELHHFGITLIPEGAFHTLFHHALGGIGYLLMTVGFYMVYKVAKGVSKKK